MVAISTLWHIRYPFKITKAFIFYVHWVYGQDKLHYPVSELLQYRCEGIYCSDACLYAFYFLHNNPKFLIMIEYTQTFFSYSWIERIHVRSGYVVILIGWFWTPIPLILVELNHFDHLAVLPNSRIQVSGRDGFTASMSSCCCQESQSWVVCRYQVVTVLVKKFGCAADSE